MNFVRSARFAHASVGLTLIVFALASVACDGGSDPDSAESAGSAPSSLDTGVAGGGSSSDTADAESTSPLQREPTNRADGPSAADYEVVSGPGQPSTSGGGGRPSTTPRLNPRPVLPDATPAELRRYLQGAKQDRNLFFSGQSGFDDAIEANRTLTEIIRRMNQAARQLIDHPDASDRDRILGRKGQLEALSFLASQNDLDARADLQTLAEENLSSSDASLVIDSRLVRMSFAMEGVQGGVADAADRIVTDARALADADLEIGLPTLMLLGEARNVLATYDFQQQAATLRSIILKEFGNSPDPQIAQLAAVQAGNVTYEATNTLLTKLVQGEPVSRDTWLESVRTLIAESPDLQTARFLAGGALELESIGRQALADDTLRTAGDAFADPKSAPSKEIALAVEARRARRSLLGRPLDIKLPGRGGDEVTLASFRGKVVLMPCWSLNLPDSMQLFPRFLEIRDANPDDIAIVGVNLDPPSAPVQEFLRKNALDFPNFGFPPTEDAETTAAELATRYGIISMPYALIVDRDGNVASIEFIGAQLDETLDRLLSE